MNPIRLDLMQRQAAQRCLFDAEVSMNPIRLDLMQPYGELLQHYTVGSQ